MAFVKDFQAFQQYNNDYCGSLQNTHSEGGHVVLGGDHSDGADDGPWHGPVSVDSWMCPSAYICMVTHTRLSDRTVWKTVWDNQVVMAMQMQQDCRQIFIFAGRACRDTSS